MPSTSSPQPSTSPPPLRAVSPAATTATGPPARAGLDVARIAAFFGLALSATTALSVPFATGALPMAALALVVPLAQLSPALAALVVRRRTDRWWRDLALTVPSWRALAVAAAIALLVVAAVPMTRALVGLGLGVPPVTDLAPIGLLVAIPAVLVVQTLTAVGEEAGWRGWLHRQLSPLGFWPASLLTGVLWALWHLPIVLALGLQGRQAVTYLVTIVAVAPLLATLREISGTAWAAVLGHGLFTSLRVAIDQNVLGPHDPALAWSLDVLSWVLWLVAARVVLTTVGRPRERADSLWRSASQEQEQEHP